MSHIKMTMEQKIAAFRDVVEKIGKIPTQKGEHTFEDGVNMGSWWGAYKRRCKTRGTSPDKRLLLVDVLRVSWERYRAIVPKPTLEQMIIACRDHVSVTGEIPSPSGEHVTKIGRAHV